MSDCEELSGSYSQEMMGLVLGGDLQDCVDFIWSVSDCEELVGAAHRR